MHSPRKPIRCKLYIDLQLADVGQSIYPLQSYMPAGQVHAGSKMGPTGYDNSQYCGEVFPFCVKYITVIQILGTYNHSFLLAIALLRF